MRRPRRRSGGFVVRYDKLHSVTAELLSDDQEVGIKQDEQHHEAAHEQAEGDSFERLPIHRDDLLWQRQKFQESLERRLAGGPRIIPIDGERQVVHGSSPDFGIPRMAQRITLPPPRSLLNDRTPLPRESGERTIPTARFAGTSSTSSVLRSRGMDVPCYKSRQANRTCLHNAEECANLANLDLSPNNEA